MGLLDLIFGKRKDPSQVVQEVTILFKEYKEKGLDHEAAMFELFKHYFPEHKNNPDMIKTMYYDIDGCLRTFCTFKIRMDCYGGGSVMFAENIDKILEPSSKLCECPLKMASLCHMHK
jgi:hypothetical protein